MWGVATWKVNNDSMLWLEVEIREEQEEKNKRIREVRNNWHEADFTTEGMYGVYGVLYTSGIHTLIHL